MSNTAIIVSLVLTFLQMDWTSNIGEHAIDIVVFSSSNAPLSMFVLGEKNFEFLVHLRDLKCFL